MSYKIIITKIETKKVTKEGDYQIVDRRPWTDEEIDKTTKHYQSNDNFLQNNPLKEVIGYAPSRESTEEKEIKVLEQTIENLDLSAVIKAINGI